MIKKQFDRFNIFLKDSYKEIIFIILFTFVLYFKLPCYIDSTGGAIDVSSRIEVADKYKSKGSFNMAFVHELPGRLIFVALAQINPNWDVVWYKDVLLENETKEDEFNRGRIMLNESFNNAIINAYELAGKSVKIKNEKLVVTFIVPESKNDLKTGDEIISINGNTVHSFAEITEEVSKYNFGDTLEIKIKRDDKEMTCHATLYKDGDDERKYIGMGVAVQTELETDPKIKLNYKDSETGPSGGLITALAIYDALTEEDLTHGLKIVGTGTMERDGSVDSIGGIKYKLAGAVKKKADIFLVPAGENYDEAVKIAKEKNYKIKIVPVKTLKDAVDYLQTLK